jgi:uncharacterized protein YjbI with pentapeptide repeats
MEITMELKTITGNLIHVANVSTWEQLLKSALKAGITDFRQADFRQADFSRADFIGADFRQADFSRADFIGADFRRADFSRADFRQANFSRADFRQADFIGANFSDADFRQADFSRANFSDVNFRNADFRNADFRYANFRYANFSDTDFRYIKGNGKEIKHLHLLWYVASVGNQLAIGCVQHPIEKWENFSDSEINDMHENALEWWKKHKEEVLTWVTL